MKSTSLSRVIVSRQGDRLFTLPQAAYLTQTSVVVLERFADLGLIEPVGSMLRLSDLTRVMQIIRLRRDLGLNLMGATIALDMAAEIARLKVQIRALRQLKP